ncbi:MAG: class I SAM-dependent methyltransferase [Planctomycetaceae bacterium]|nr:class I SAM-dependent methyltransferase [Planctomycetaceae bacterium]
MADSEQLRSTDGNIAAQTCPLCFAVDVNEFFADWRTYLQCPCCRLVFVPPRDHVSRNGEKLHYDRHENSPDDDAYRNFLSRMFDPMQEQLLQGSHGLDFGAGPGPTLSKMFAEAGHTMQVFDPFYAPNHSVFLQQYNFITATEVFEHLRRPRYELERLWRCLRPGGILGLMTKRVLDRDVFATWHYNQDPTHICFASLQTFEWLAELWNADLIVPSDDVALLQKST